MDNAPSHIIPEKLTNVQCEFLPPTTTSHLQPMDAGIINAYKAHYRRCAVRFCVDAIDAGRKPQIELSDAIRWTKLSWDNVTADTIKNCWYHTRILPADVATAGMMTSSAALADGVSVISSSGKALRDFGNLFEGLSQMLNISTELRMTPDEFVSVDAQLPTCEPMNDLQILATVSQVEERSSDETEEDGGPYDSDQPERVAHVDAVNAIDTLMRYFEQSALATPDDIQPLSVLKRRVDYLRQ